MTINATSLSTLLRTAAAAQACEARLPKLDGVTNVDRPTAAVATVPGVVQGQLMRDGVQYLLDRFAATDAVSKGRFNPPGGSNLYNVSSSLGWLLQSADEAAKSESAISGEVMHAYREFANAVEEMIDKSYPRANGYYCGRTPSEDLVIARDRAVLAANAYVATRGTEQVVKDVIGRAVVPELLARVQRLYPELFPDGQWSGTEPFDASMFLQSGHMEGVCDLVAGQLTGKSQHLNIVDALLTLIKVPEFVKDRPPTQPENAAPAAASPDGGQPPTGAGANHYAPVTVNSPVTVHPASVHVDAVRSTSESEAIAAVDRANERMYQLCMRVLDLRNQLHDVQNVMPGTLDVRRDHALVGRLSAEGHEGLGRLFHREDSTGVASRGQDQLSRLHNHKLDERPGSIRSLNLHIRHDASPPHDVGQAPVVGDLQGEGAQTLSPSGIHDDDAFDPLSSTSVWSSGSDVPASDTGDEGGYDVTIAEGDNGRTLDSDDEERGSTASSNSDPVGRRSSQDQAQQTSATEGGQVDEPLDEVDSAPFSRNRHLTSSLPLRVQSRVYTGDDATRMTAVRHLLTVQHGQYKVLDSADLQASPVGRRDAGDVDDHLDAEDHEERSSFMRSTDKPVRLQPLPRRVQSDQFDQSTAAGVAGPQIDRAFSSPIQAWMPRTGQAQRSDAGLSNDELRSAASTRAHSPSAMSDASDTSTESLLARVTARLSEDERKRVEKSVSVLREVIRRINEEPDQYSMAKPIKFSVDVAGGRTEWIELKKPRDTWKLDELPIFDPRKPMPNVELRNQIGVGPGLYAHVWQGHDGKWVLDFVAEARSRPALKPASHRETSRFSNPEPFVRALSPKDPSMLEPEPPASRASTFG